MKSKRRRPRLLERTPFAGEVSSNRVSSVFQKKMEVWRGGGGRYGGE